MKLSRSVYTAILGFMSTSILASSFDKFYVSADVGIFQADFKNKYLDQTDTIPQNIAQISTQNGYIGGIAFGYRQFLNLKYFLGGELSANMVGNNASFQSGASSSAFSDQIKMNTFFDVSFIPGLMLSNSIASFLKLGMSLAFLEDSLVSPGGFNSTVVNTYRNKNVIGFAAGLGVFKLLTEHVSLFTEADYHDYGSVDFPNFQNFMATYSHSTHIYSYDVVLGASYRF